MVMNRPDPEGDATELINLYELCKRFGVLPYSGGLVEQPAKIVYLFTQMSLFETEREKREADRERERQRANNQGR